MSIRRVAAEAMRAACLSLIETRVAICAEEEARQIAMNCGLGAATERSAKFEAELLAQYIRALPTLARDRP